PAAEDRADARFDRAWTISIRPALLVLLGTISASIFQLLVALVNSISRSCPFSKRAFAPFFNMGAIISNKSGSGAKARAVTYSAIEPSVGTSVSIRAACKIAGTFVARTASRKKEAFFKLLSIR